MKKITINSNEFELEDTSYSFLQNYLNRTKKYIENNSLDIGLYEDIEERISEKLYSYNIDSGSITEKDVIAIVNEIGESEDIFRDYAKNDSKSKFSPDSLNSGLKKSLYKNSADGVLFGVCQGLGEFFDINPIWIRVFFVVSLLFFGTGILVYILLAIILPNKNQDKADIEGNIKSAADKIGELAANPRIRETGMGIGLVMNRIFMIIGRLISIVLFFFLGMFIMAASIGIIIVGSMLRMGLVIDNQDIFSYVPGYSFFFFAIAGISLFVISVASLAVIFKKEGIVSGKVALGLLAIAGLGVFGMLSSFFETAGNYAESFDRETYFALSGSGITGSGITINFDDIAKNSKGPFIGKFLSLKFLKSADSDIHIKVTDLIRARNEQKGNILLENLNPIKGVISNNILTLGNEGNSDFKSIVPFSFLQRNLEISIPQNKEIRILKAGYLNFRIEDMKVIDKNGEVYEGGFHCSEGIIKYNEEYKEFICYANN